MLKISIRKFNYPIQKVLKIILFVFDTIGNNQFQYLNEKCIIFQSGPRKCFSCAKSVLQKIDNNFMAFLVVFMFLEHFLGVLMFLELFSSFLGNFDDFQYIFVYNTIRIFRRNLIGNIKYYFKAFCFDHLSFVNRFFTISTTDSFIDSAINGSYATGIQRSNNHLLLHQNRVYFVKFSFLFILVVFNNAKSKIINFFTLVSLFLYFLYKFKKIIIIILNVL